MRGRLSWSRFQFHLVPKQSRPLIFVNEPQSNMPKHRSGGGGGGDGGPHKKSRGDKHKRRHRHRGEGKKKSHGGGQRSEEPADDTAPAPTFDALNLKPALLRGIYAFGFERPSAIQQRAIRPIVRGRDVIAQSQSGTVSLLVSIFLGSRPELLPSLPSLPPFRSVSHGFVFSFNSSPILSNKTGQDGRIFYFGPSDAGRTNVRSAGYYPLAHPRACRTDAARRQGSGRLYEHQGPLLHRWQAPRRGHSCL